MTRRTFVRMAPALAISAVTPATLIVPVHRAMNTRARCTPEQLSQFWWKIWPEAVRDFHRSGIDFQTTDGTLEIKRSPGDRPIFTALKHAAINLVITDQIPMAWDNGRALAGVTTRYESYHLCLIALNHAHGHQVPFLSVNTCVHEILHALLQDIFEPRPKGLAGYGRELRIDSYATCLWLFGDSGAVRKSAEVYLRRLGPRAA